MNRSEWITRCPGCGSLLGPGEKKDPGLCSACFHRLESERKGPYCETCGVRLVSEQRNCLRCREYAPEFIWNQSLWEYVGLPRHLLESYKFGGARGLAVIFAWFLDCFLETNGMKGIPIIPVPCNPRSLRRKGWDHMRVITAVLQRRHGHRILVTLKRRHGISQKQLGFRERQKNLDGKITVYPNRSIPPRILLLDDIVTTGGTLNACTRVLKKAGVQEVYALSLARD